MKITQLKHFIICADLGSLSAASEKLFVSRQALSTSIQTLEADLGVNLFLRTKKGIELTLAGSYLYDRAKLILSTYDEVMNHFAMFDSLQGDIVIACNNSHKEFILSIPLSYFFKHQPNVKICFKMADMPTTVSLLQRKEADFGIITTGYGKNVHPTLPNDIEFLPLFEQPLSVVLSEKSIYYRNASISISELKKERIILEREHDFAGDIFFRILSHYNLTENIILADSAKLFHALIQENAGMGITAGTKNYQKDNLKHIPVRETIMIVTGIAKNKDVTESIPCKLFVEQIIHNSHRVQRIR